MRTLTPKQTVEAQVMLKKHGRWTTYCHLHESHGLLASECKRMFDEWTEKDMPIILTEEVARKIWDAAIECAADRVSKVYGSTVQPTDFDTFYKKLTEGKQCDPSKE